MPPPPCYKNASTLRPGPLYPHCHGKNAQGLKRLDCSNLPIRSLRQDDGGCTPAVVYPKLDAAFICNMMQQIRYRAVIRSTLKLARELDMSVVAEGIESEAQLNCLRSMGCVRIKAITTHSR